jgi:hypothetical protein
LDVLQSLLSPRNPLELPCDNDDAQLSKTTTR